MNALTGALAVSTVTTAAYQMWTRPNIDAARRLYLRDEISLDDFEHLIARSIGFEVDPLLPVLTGVSTVNEMRQANALAVERLGINRWPA